MPAKLKYISLRSPDGDKRRFTRISIDVPADIIVAPDPDVDDSYLEDGDSPSVDVTVTNLSPSGLYFVSRNRYETGQHVWISLDLGPDQAVIRARIVRRDTVANDFRETNGYGVQFLKTEIAANAIKFILHYLQGQARSIEAIATAA